MNHLDVLNQLPSSFTTVQFTNKCTSIGLSVKDYKSVNLLLSDKCKQIALGDNQNHMWEKSFKVIGIRK